MNLFMNQTHRYREPTCCCQGWGGRVMEEEGTTEDEMAGWHHWLDGHESEWAPGVGDGQGGLACCDSWGLKESDTTEWLNWTELNIPLDIYSTSSLSILLSNGQWDCFHLFILLDSRLLVFTWEIRDFLWSLCNTLGNLRNPFFTHPGMCFLPKPCLTSVFYWKWPN